MPAVQRMYRRICPQSPCISWLCVSVLPGAELQRKRVPNIMTAKAMRKYKFKSAHKKGRGKSIQP